MPKKSRKRTKNLYDIEIVQVDKERKRFKIHFVRLGLEINSTSGVISVPAVDSFRLFGETFCPRRRIIGGQKEYFSWAFIPSY